VAFGDMRYPALAMLLRLARQYCRQQLIERVFQHRVKVGGSSPEADRLGSAFRKRRSNMEYFDGLDVSPAFSTGYQLTSNMTAALDQEIRIACRLYTVIMLCVLFLSQLRFLDKAERQVSRLKELLGFLEGLFGI
jgi:hypothetical protein